MDRRQHDKHHCYVTCHGHQYRLLRPWSDHRRLDLPSSGQTSVQPWSWSQCRICGSVGIGVLRTDYLLSAAEQQGTVESRWSPLGCLRVLVVPAGFLWLGSWLDTPSRWNSFRVSLDLFLGFVRLGTGLNCSRCELVKIFQSCADSKAMSMRLLSLVVYVPCPYRSSRNEWSYVIIVCFYENKYSPSFNPLPLFLCRVSRYNGGLAGCLTMTMFPSRQDKSVA